MAMFDENKAAPSADTTPVKLLLQLGLIQVCTTQLTYYYYYYIDDQAVLPLFLN